MLALEMADDRLDRRTASYLALDLRRRALLLAGGVVPEPVIVRSGVAAITGIGEDAFEPSPISACPEWSPPECARHKGCRVAWRHGPRTSRHGRALAWSHTETRMGGAPCPCRCTRPLARAGNRPCARAGAGAAPTRGAPELSGEHLSQACSSARLVVMTQDMPVR